MNRCLPSDFVSRDFLVEFPGHEHRTPGETSEQQGAGHRWTIGIVSVVLEVLQSGLTVDTQDYILITIVHEFCRLKLTKIEYNFLISVMALLETLVGS